MVELATDLLAVGKAALAAGDWAAARAAFEAALDEEDAPAARDGLARALWWIEGPAQAIAERTHAYSGYRHCGDERSAAHVALWIAHEYEVGFGQPGCGRRLADTRGGAAGAASGGRRPCASRARAR